jgi:methyl-accepting chemotaxis protein
MTVGKKLTICFGAMSVLMAAMGIASLNSVEKLKTELDTATRKTARRLQLARTMDTAGSDMLAGMRGIVMFTFAKNPANAQMGKSQFDTAADHWQKAIDEVRPLIVREDGRAVINQLQDQLTRWRALIEDIQQAAGRGDPASALAAALSKGLPIYKENTDSAEHFRNIQNVILVQQQAAGESIYSLSRWTAIALLGLTLLAGVVVILVVRRTSRVLQEAAGELSCSSEQVASAASQIACSSQSLAQGASEQAASVEETSASAEELAGMTRKNADDSRLAAELMNEASAVVDQANRTLGEMEASMWEINASSERISKVIKVIDEIAFQTNILALNAAVEAARAGDAGMGFAVVADEVRNLAQRSAQAAKETQGMIEESVEKSVEGRAKLQHVAEAIHQVTEKSAKVKKLIDDLYVSSGEQAHGVDQIAKAVTQAGQITQSSAASAEETASAGQELSAQASTLEAVAAKLETLVGTAGDGHAERAAGTRLHSGR